MRDDACSLFLTVRAVLMFTYGVDHWMDDGELHSAAASARKECWILVACNAPCGIVFISRETVSLFFYSSF
jgi:hypothetical protein